MSARKIDIQGFKEMDPNRAMNVGQIVPLVEDFIALKQAVERDFRNIRRDLQGLNENHERLKREVDSGFVIIANKIDTYHPRSSDPPERTEAPQNVTEPEHQTENQEEEDDNIDLNVLGSDFMGHGIRLTPYTGEEDITFSTWLRKFQDYADAQPRPWTDKQKAQKLKFFLDGLPREEYETFTNEEKQDFNRTISKLREIFESPKMRNMARQKLMNCKQKDGESVSRYAERIRCAVRSATVGLSEQTFKETLMDHFIAGLNNKIRFFVQNAEPPSFEQAFLKAQHIESLLLTEADPITALVNALSSNHISTYHDSGNFNRSKELESTINELSGIKEELRRFNRNGYVNSNPAPVNRTQQGQNFPPYRKQYYDRNVVQEGHRYERHFDRRPYCTYCHKIGHLAYDCFHRQPPNVRPQQYYPGPRARPNQRYRPNNRFNPRDQNRMYQPPAPEQQRGTYRNTVTKRPSINTLTDSYREEENSDTTMTTSDARRLGRSAYGEYNQGPEIGVLDFNVVHSKLHHSVQKNQDAQEWENLIHQAETEPVDNSGLKLRSSLGYGKLLCCAITIILLCLSTQICAVSAPRYPLVCHLTQNHLYWKIPKVPSCPTLDLTNATQLKNVSLTVYRPNTIRYETSAFACRIVHKKVYYYTNFFNDKFNRKEIENLVLSTSECRQMMKHKTCKYGILVLKGEIYQTENKLEFDYPLPILGSFSEKMIEAINCYMFQSSVTATHDGELTSPAGDMESCYYEEGNCHMKDNSILIWTPEQAQKCRFVKIKKWQGHFLGNVWLAESKEFALSFPEVAIKVNDCDRDLVISDQEYAVDATEIHPFKRYKRSTVTNSITGVVTTNQLAAQLQALQAGLVESLTFSFQHSLLAVCDTVKMVAKQMLTSFATNPTLAARTLLNKTDIQARIATTIFEIWPCTPLLPGSYRFLSVNNSICFEFPPIQFEIMGQTFKGYLDPRTMIISEISRKIPCDLAHDLPVEISGRPYMLDQVTGNLIEIPVDRISKIQSNLHQPYTPTIPNTVFHNLVITNISEVFPSLHFEMISKMQAVERTIDTDSFHLRDGASMPEYQSLFSSQINKLIQKPWTIWVTMVCLYITLKLGLKFAIRICFPNLAMVLNYLKRINRISLPMGRPRAVPNIKFQTHGESIQFDTSPNNSKSLFQWPPRIHVPEFTLSIVQRTRSSTLTTVKGSINSITFTLLIDTGSAITIASVDLVQPLAVKLIPHTARAIGVSGDPVYVTSAARVNITIGNASVATTMYFTENPALKPGQKAYDIIIGCDTLKLFPPFKIDIRNGWFSMLDQKLPLNPPTTQNVAAAPVRVVGNIEIPSLCEKFVPCLLDVNLVEGITAFIVEEPSEALSQSDLFLTPSVVEPLNGTIFVLISNPTNEPKFLHNKMCLAYASILVNHEGFLEVPDKPRAVINTLIDENDVQPDPSFRVDYHTCQISPLELLAVKTLIAEYSDIFSRNKYDLGSCSAVKHDLITTTDTPVVVKPTRVPFQYREEIQNQIDELVKCGVLKESKTNWVANLVLVQKKDGGLRMCVDFRKLNAVTVQETFPLPRLDALLEKIGSCEYYSTLDLSQGFLQIKVSQNMSNKLGVIVEDKCYQYTHLPFGLKNATSIFCRTMSKVFAGLEDGVCFYVDDILVYSKSKNFSDHLKILRNVFQRLRDFHLKLSPKKCHFAQKSTTFLGHTISKYGYKPSSANLEAIENFPVPQTLTEVRRFCGLAGFYRKFIPEFARLSTPLTELTKKYQRFMWGPRQQEAFEEIKALLLQEPILTYPNYDKEFHIFTDCSAVAQAGALMQLADNETNKYHAICYCSRTFTESERKWPIIQAELATIVYALRSFRPYIFMSKSVVHCDHKPLSYVLKKTEAHPNLARWIIELQTYNITIQFIKGEQNKVADALSRVKPDRTAAPKNEEMEDIINFPHCLAAEKIDDSIVNIPAPDKFVLQDSYQGNYVIDLVHEQKLDPKLLSIILFLREGKIPASLEHHEADKFVEKCSKYAIDDTGCLRYCFSNNPTLLVNCKQSFQDYPIVIPASLQNLIFDYFHLSPLAGGHLNFKKVLHKSKKYYWETKYSDIYRWTKACLTCQMRNNPRPYPKVPLNPVVNGAVMNQIGLDLCGPFPTTEKGNKHIMNVICMFTKYVVSVPVEDARSTTLAKALLNNCVLIYGAPNIINTDNATAFSSSFFQEFCSMLYINKRYSIPYYSAGNGAVERTFKTYQNMLAKYISDQKNDFDEFLPFMSFCYNTAVNEMTGESPYFLMFGRDPRFSIEDILKVKTTTNYSEDEIDIFKGHLIQSLKHAWQLAYEFNLRAQARMKKIYDRHAKNSNIQIGDRVLLLRKQVALGNQRKFHLPWTGIYRVIDIQQPTATIISCAVANAKPLKVHLNQLKKHISLEGPACTLPTLPTSEQQALKELKADEVEDLPGYMSDIPEEVVGNKKQEIQDTAHHHYNLRSRDNKKQE